jgi:hypothetical protein
MASLAQRNLFHDKIRLAVTAVQRADRDDHRDELADCHWDILFDAADVYRRSSAAFDLQVTRLDPAMVFKG